MSASKYLERTDSFQHVIVEDLLGQMSNWRDVQDIVRLTFKALTETVKSQGNAIKDLEKQVAKKPTKQEIYSLLQEKASFQDTQHQFSELKMQIDSKTPIEEFDQLQKLQNMQIYDIEGLAKDLSNLNMQQNQNNQLKDLRVDIHSMEQKLAILETESEKLRQKLNMQQDHIQDTLVDKVTQEELHILLDQKVSKQGLAQFLDNKVSKLELKTYLETKADVSDIENIFMNIKSKVSYQEFEQSQIENVNKLQKVLNLQQLKVDKEQFEKYNQMQRQFNLDQQENIKVQLDDVIQQTEDMQNKNQILQKMMDFKANQTDLDQIRIQNLEKMNIQDFKEQQQQQKEEFLDYYKEINLNVKNNQLETQEQLLQQKQAQDQVNDKINERFSKYSQQVNEIREQQDKYEMSEVEKSKEIQRRIGQVQKTITSVEQELERQNQLVQQEQTLKLSKTDFISYKNDLESQVEQKVDLQECQQALNTLQKDLAKRLQDLETNLKQVLESQNNQIQLNNDQNQEFLQNSKNEFASQDDFIDLRQFLERGVQNIEKKADNDQIQEELQQFKKQIVQNSDQVKKIQSLKHLEKSEQNRNLQQISNMIQQLQQNVEKKVDSSEIQQQLQEQNMLSQQLCSENIVGRWTWKSGKLCNGNQVPWEIEAINCMPSNYGWEKNTNEILVATPGLYQIYCGFYCRKKPSIQILINGDPIMCAVNTSSYVIHHSAGKLKDIKHSSGQTITGLTLVDFIIIPCSAKISICYSGDTKCEGFLGLKRM